MTRTMTVLSLCLVGAFAAASLEQADAARSTGGRRAKRHQAYAARTKPARAARGSGSPGAFGSGVYGASAPYYLVGPGNGGGYAYDPIGGPNHVGNGGPGANLGGSTTRFTDAEARYLAGWR